jgi:FHS family L-fucose permease-like MFS transporter
METKQQNKSLTIVTIVAMMFLYAMISFVTNLAAPVGKIWGASFEDPAQAERMGMLGNLFNFLAYLIMGIPAGNILAKRGYKSTALAAISLGFIGIGFQWMSGVLDSFAVYLVGALFGGFCVCMLNTVVNPMLNTLGGGGNRGNQLIQTGGTLNSLTGTLTPLLVGALIGTVTDRTAMSDVAPLLFIAMGVFALAFVILLFVSIPEPSLQKEKTTVKDTHSAWSFRHLVLGVVAIFFYVGTEVGIPAELNFYLTDDPLCGAAIGGAVAAVYWLLMMVGRAVSASISGKVSTRTQLSTVSLVAIVLIVVAIILPSSIRVSMPGYSVAEGFSMFQVPLSALFLVLCGLCTSLMWGAIFNLAVEGLGKYTPQASGIFMMMVVGGGVMPLLQNWLAGAVGYMGSYWMVVAMLAYILFYALAGSKNVNRDIPVE